MIWGLGWSSIRSSRSWTARICSDIKDPTGKRLLVEFAETVKRQREGFVDYQWPKPGA